MLKYFCLVICLMCIACKDAAKQNPKQTENTSSKKDSLSTDLTNEENEVFNISPSIIKKDSIVINLAKGMNFKLAVPKGYKISIAAEGLKRLRFMTVSTDGKLFCTDMYDRSDNKKGRVYIFEDRKSVV